MNKTITVSLEKSGWEKSMGARVWMSSEGLLSISEWQECIEALIGSRLCGSGILTIKRLNE